MKKVIFYLIIFVVGFVGVSLWSFWLITHPPKIIIGTTPEDVGLKYENVELRTKDGLKLAAWFIPKQEVGSEKLEVSETASVQHPTSNLQSLILVHGYPAEKADLLFLAQRLTSHFSLLLFDMRYFGKSDGAASTLGKKELLDLEAALDFLEKRLLTQAVKSERLSPSGPKLKIGVFGFSLGGSVAIMKAAEDLPAGKAGPRISAVAAYAPFANLKLLGYDAYKNLWILKYPLVELLSLWAKIFFDYDVAALSPEKAAEKLQIPVFLFHQQQDDQIPFEHALRLQKALSNNSQAHSQFPDYGAHGDFPFDFDQNLLEFFTKNLSI